ncbi:MAG: NADH-quinone oxidoreductase subunit L [Acidimicrobiales bacterium]|nr:NADH-quinone oxidoreductase subunit L [Acidimicrobiales bacterium]
MELLDLTFLIPALPLLGFVLLVAFGKRLGEPLAGWFATAMVGGSFLATVLVFFGLLGRDEAERGLFGHDGGDAYVQKIFTWIPAGDFSVDIGFLADPLSIGMALFVTGVGTLIHLYSIGYMHGDEQFSKFFVYLNLCVFSMLVLILGDNLLLTFLGWEGVGACSYLLISFWFTDPANATAGKKAFVTNRIGDWGFMVAMFLVFFTFGSIAYADFLPQASGTAQVTATAITLLLLVGAAGKSAQFPLYLWLPDAMAGPTPVSALIHAATMVTSGVYLLTRMNPVLDVAAGHEFLGSLTSLDLIAWVGAFTALFAATIAVSQNDIKKVLAYSTVSQLGYMFLAVGTGAYVAAIFHMITHAFFKALLFLGSGSVIHGMHHDQDMRNYGGLRKLMPITAITFIVGWLAIAGVPPLSGFWSKDEILLGAWESNKVLWVIGLVTAVLTAFYMSRQVFMTFFGRYRYADVRQGELNEAWDARLAAADEAVAAAEAKQAESTEALDKAESALNRAVAAVEPANQALADAEDDDGRAAATTELEKANAAVVGARDALPTAQAAVADYTVASSNAADDAAKLRSLANAGRTLVRGDDGSPALPDGIDGHLPASVAERREFHPHESPWTMTLPLIALSGLAVVAGVLNLPFKFGHQLEHWLEPIFVHPHEVTSSGNTKVVLALIATACGVLGIGIAYAIYIRKSTKPIEPQLLADGWKYDSAISAFMGGPGRKFFDLVAWFDSSVVDGLVNGAGKLVQGVATPMRTLQSGLVRTYASGIALGAIALVCWFLFRAAL